jgi:predicted amidophosphoribosyltransferase
MAFDQSSEDTPEGKLVSLGEYLPWKLHKERGGALPEHSQRIWDVKDKKARGLTYFFDYLAPKIKAPTAVAVVPSHDATRGPTSGVHSLANRLAGELKLSNGGACLVRHTTVPKLATGGGRDIDVHLNSIRVDHPERIAGHIVLLLDDVTTSGNSLMACKRLLLAAGAKEVRMVALGRTVH